MLHVGKPNSGDTVKNTLKIARIDEFVLTPNSSENHLYDMMSSIEKKIKKNNSKKKLLQICVCK